MKYSRSRFYVGIGKSSLLPLLAIGCLFGCAETQKVTYSLENVPRATESRIKNVRLVIGPLSDDRHGSPDNQVLFTSSNETTLGKESYCVNSESGYGKDYVGTQISRMMAEHLRQRGKLGAVSAGARAGDAYFLAGQLRHFYGAQRSTSISPATGAVFGAIGAGIAAASVPDVTPGEISIEIVGVVLYDAAGKPVARLPDVRYKKKLDLPASSSCLIVYKNVNDQLKQLFESYTPTVERAIEEAVNPPKPKVVANDVPVGVQPPEEPW
jgi:hypothetical protein